MTDAEWEATWTTNASAFDRVRSVVMALPEPKSAAWLADHARVSESTASEHLDRLVDMGLVAAHTSDNDPRYGPDPAYIRFREIRELTADYDRAELREFVAELKASIATIDEQYDAATPEELRATANEPAVSAETARELRDAAADWEHYDYRLGLLNDAINRYDAYTESATPA